jgi:hypothetical protein
VVCEICLVCEFVRTVPSHALFVYLILVKNYYFLCKSVFIKVPMTRNFTPNVYDCIVKIT